jgi:OFA family oxalate/formate antiporter-like MFS transporter
MSSKSALLLDFGLLALSSLVLLALPGPGLLAVFLVVYGFSVAARDVVYPLIITHCFGVRDLARIYGVLMLALLPGGALGPIFAGWVHDRTGSYDSAFAVFAGLNLLALFALVFVRRETAR